MGCGGAAHGAAELVGDPCTCEPVRALGFGGTHYPYCLNRKRRRCRADRGPWARCGRSWSGSKRGERKTVGEYKRPNVKQCSYMEAREEGMAAELLGEARVVQAYR